MTETWSYWSGTPELFAHLVRTAERGMPAGSTVTTVIDVCVKDDHEIFESPAEFVERATLDALRRFKSITATVTAGGDTSTITVRWRMPWWQPWGRGPDAEVILEVTGEAVESRSALIRPAILRGRAERSLVQVALVWLVAAIVAGAFVVSGAYLVSVDFSLELAVVAASVGWIIGSFWGTWVFPSIEVAPTGQSNLRRLIRVGGPIVVTVILAGLTKKLFG